MACCTEGTDAFSHTSLASARTRLDLCIPSILVPMAVELGPALRKEDEVPRSFACTNSSWEFGPWARHGRNSH